MANRYNIRVISSSHQHSDALIESRGRCGCVDGRWNFDNYHIITLGDGDVSVRCLAVVANQRIWCAHRNSVHVVNPETLKIEVCHSLMYLYSFFLCIFVVEAY